MKQKPDAAPEPNRKVRAAAFALSVAAAGVCMALLCFPAAAKAGALAGLRLCFGSLVPALLPFMVLSNWMLRLRPAGAGGRCAAAVANHLFRLPPDGLLVLLFSLVGGFPVGGTLAVSLMTQRRISRRTAQRLLLFCVCPGPAFAISAVGVGMCGSAKAGVLLYVSLAGSALLLGVLSRRYADEPTLVADMSALQMAQSGLCGLTDAVAESVSALLQMCGWVCFVSALLGVLDALALPPAVGLAARAVCEVTAGCTAAAKLPLPLVAAILGWGGVCVHLQLLPQIFRARLPLRRFVLFRACSAALSALLCKGLLHLFPVAAGVLLQDGAPPVPRQSASFAVSAGLLAMCLLLLLGNDYVVGKRPLAK